VALIQVGLRTGPRRWLVRGWPRGHSGARELTNGSATERGEHRDPGSGLTEARAAVGMRHDGGDKRQRLELGVRELEREGKRVGEGRGRSSPFIGLAGRQRWPG
jgi:hypothetical protein